MCHHLTKTYEKLVIFRSLKNTLRKLTKIWAKTVHFTNPTKYKMEPYEISDVHPTITPMSIYNLELGRCDSLAEGGFIWLRPEGTARTFSYW